MSQKYEFTKWYTNSLIICNLNNLKYDSSNFTIQFLEYHPVSISADQFKIN